MNDIRTYAYFEAAFEDDDEFSDEGNLISIGGKNVSDVFMDMIKRTGLADIWIEPHDYYGWSIFASDGKYRYWFMIQHAEPWILMAETLGFFTRKARARAALHQWLVKLNAEIGSDARFSDVRWYTPKEHEAGETKGALAP